MNMRLQIVKVLVLVVTLLLGSQGAVLSQTAGSPTNILKLAEEYVTKANAATTLQKQELASVFSGVVGRVFEVKVNCADVEMRDEVAFLTHKQTYELIFEFPLDETAPENAGKARQINRGDDVRLRAVLIGPPFYREPRYLGTSGIWVVPFDKGIVLEVTSPKK